MKLCRVKTYRYFYEHPILRQFAVLLLVGATYLGCFLMLFAGFIYAVNNAIFASEVIELLLVGLAIAIPPFIILVFFIPSDDEMKLTRR